MSRPPENQASETRPSESKLSETRPPEIRAAVIGGGSWGTAFARLLAGTGLATELICRRPEQAEAINAGHRNPDYLTDIDLPESVTASSFAENRLGESSLVVIAVPSKAFRGVISSLAASINPEASVLSLTKGLEPETLKRMS
ncbi:MAG: NAD(P)-binding domain-containing protein, partial [Actinomycetota bacterium]